MLPNLLTTIILIWLCAAPMLAIAKMLSGREW